VRGRVNWIGAETALFLGIELAAQLFRNRSGNLIFQEQDIPRAAFVAFGPDVPIGLCLYQLRRDSYPAAGVHHGSLHHGIDAQLAGNLRQGLVVHALVLHH
jgi:hypothetical protein